MQWLILQMLYLCNCKHLNSFVFSERYIVETLTMKGKQLSFFLDLANTRRDGIFPVTLSIPENFGTGQFLQFADRNIGGAAERTDGVKCRDNTRHKQLLSSNKYSGRKRELVLSLSRNKHKADFRLQLTIKRKRRFSKIL